MDYSSPDSSVHGILQAGILQWFAMPSSRGPSRLGDRTCVSCMSRWILYHSATREAPHEVSSLPISSERTQAQNFSYGILCRNIFLTLIIHFLGPKKSYHFIPMTTALFGLLASQNSTEAINSTFTNTCLKPPSGPRQGPSTVFFWPQQNVGC